LCRCPATGAAAQSSAATSRTARDIKAIHIEIYKKAEAEGYELKLMDEKSMEPLLDWLKSADFDPAKGRDGKAPFFSLLA
jgi:hypothetical protein